MFDRVDGVRGAHYQLRIPLRVPLNSDAVDAGPGIATVASPSVPRILLRRKVLVVDDSEGNRRLARRMLQQLGCEVLEATDGDEVIDALAGAAGAPGDSGNAVDIVLMDIEMARVGGVAAVEAMRRAGWLIPVIAATGNSDAEAAADCAWAARVEVEVGGGGGGGLVVGVVVVVVVLVVVVGGVTVVLEGVHPSHVYPV